ncbi:MAG: hypothetical protein C6W56_03610 [Caldibacillus debilis]|nr:MAG: hypothetical protein C6W56_03610 [Caldibacillus debilis]
MQKISEQRSGPAGAAAFFSAIHEDLVCLPLLHDGGRNGRGAGSKKLICVSALYFRFGTERIIRSSIHLPSHSGFRFDPGRRKQRNAGRQALMGSAMGWTIVVPECGLTGTGEPCLPISPNDRCARMRTGTEKFFPMPWSVPHAMRKNLKNV